MEALKIGVYGLNSTHFDAFHEVFSEKKEIEIYCAHDENIETSNRRKKEYGNFIKFGKEYFSKCDGFMILNRFGDEHLEPFEKLIKYKKPIFIDKPITLTTEDAEKISEISNREEIQTSSNSPLEFSKEFVELQSYIKRIDGRLNIIFQGPMECNDLGSDIRFKSPLFYGIHIFEMISRVIVENSFVINKIHRNGKLLTIDCDKVAFEVYLHKDSCEFYSISTISIEEQKNFDVNLDGSYYDGFTDYLVNFFLSKFKGKDLLKKSLRAMEFSESYK